MSQHPMVKNEPSGRGPKVIVAAGALLWRGDGGGHKLLALVHRNSYDDWSLPKGKQEGNESLLETALREVQEETGCHAVATGFAGMIDYRARGTPKVVFFWNMIAAGNDPPFVSKEVDQVIWVPQKRAIETVSYKEERGLLEMTNTNQISTLGKAFLEIRKFMNPRRTSRIRGAIQSYRLEIDQRFSQISGPEGKTPDRVKAIREILDVASANLQNNRLDEAWKCLFAAQRIEVLCLEGKDREIKAISLRREAEKLSSWRKRAVEDLLGTSEHPKTDVCQSEVYEAMLIRDEHYSNMTYKNGIVSTYVWVLVAILILALWMILQRAEGGQLSIDGLLGSEGDSKLLFNVVIFGILGASYSATLKVPETSKYSKIPELVGTIRVTLMRIIVGAVSAVVVFLVLNVSGVKSLFQAVFNLDDLKRLTLPLIYFISFAAGFSERLVLKAVEFVAKEKK